MLKSFIGQLGKVPPVPPVKKQMEPLQATNRKLVPLVPPVPPKKTIVQSETYVTCGQCLNFKSHNAQGSGSGYCTIGGDYGFWSETPHQCTKFDAAVEWVELSDTFKPGAIIVTCYTPAGKPIEVMAASPEHATRLKRMNPPLSVGK